MLFKSGIQSIKLTVNNLKPTDLIMDADKFNQHIKDQQRPFLEVNAQFGSIKSLVCPKQIHLLTEMITKINDYIEAATTTKKALQLLKQKQLYLNRLLGNNNNNSKSSSRNFKLGSKLNSKQIRGCSDKRKFESLLQNDLLYGASAAAGVSSNDDDQEEVDLNDDDENDNFKSVLMTNRAIDESSMFYSMMSESTLQLNSQKNASMNNNSKTAGINLNETYGDSSENLNDSKAYLDDEDRAQVTLTQTIKKTIEQLQDDVIVSNSTTTNKANNKTQHNLFQTFRVTFRMFSLTVLHHDPIYTKAKQQQQQQQNSVNSSTRRLIVERMKNITDTYFDFVSTIDTSMATSSSSSSSSSSMSSSAKIDKHIVAKYHQACAFDDHFLVLLKPINFNLVQKINQRNLNEDDPTFGLIQYSLNDISLTVGYLQVSLF